jgi:triphosphoribosyl-dephospho-CoA synthase
VIARMNYAVSRSTSAPRWACSSRQSQFSAAGQLAAQATFALIAEATLTPKPALIDQRGSGAHRDMDLLCLLRSAHALKSTFFEMARTATGRTPSLSLRERLGYIGRVGELDMLRATGGVNAHRGAIWAVGLLVAATAVAGRGANAASIANIAGRLANYVDRFAPVQDSHGSQVCARFGVPGARGEAQLGFPHVVNIGLPALLAARARGVDERHARLDALMAIMSSLQDTCLLHRGGRRALREAQHGASMVLQAGGTSAPGGLQALFAFEKKLLKLNASPGGCADLLAACLFLDPARNALDA